MSQTVKIRRHLESGESLTPQQALMKFRSYRLASVIHRLKRRDGLNIETTMCFDDRGASYAEYSMPVGVANA